MTTNRPSDELIACKVILMAELPSSAKSCAGVLLHRMNWKTGRCDPGLHTIARDAGISLSAARKGIAALKAADFIKIDLHGGGSDRNRYSFNWPLLRNAFDRFLDDSGLTGRRANPAPNVTGGMPQKEQGTLPQMGHQTLRTNPPNKPSQHQQVERPKDKAVFTGPDTEPVNRFALGSDLVPKTNQVDEDRQGGSSGLERQRFLVHAIPGGKAATETASPSRRSVAKAQAEKRLDEGMRRLGTDVYVRLVEAVEHDSPAYAAAIEAEINQRGSGLNVLRRSIAGHQSAPVSALRNSSPIGCLAS